MTFKEELNALENDIAIQSYFKERSLIDFMKKYIKIIYFTSNKNVATTTLRGMWYTSFNEP